jgi:hypothetical protein
MSGTLHLAYALYLIAHNDKIPKRLLRRLRDPKTFMSAYYEALVGAVLAVAGFQITSGETKATSESTPEFRARSKTSGKVYEVEAKRKDLWTAPTSDVSSQDFKDELERYVRNQIYHASTKRLQNPIFWIELSIPTLSTEVDWRSVAALRVTKQPEHGSAETITAMDFPNYPKQNIRSKCNDHKVRGVQVNYKSRRRNTSVAMK